jgi:hypothetical protein
MTERPILFSAPMVRAILAGQKTQTRRAVKPQPQNDPAKHHPIAPYNNGRGSWNWVLAATGHGTGDPFPCPYGVPGDLLWARESLKAVYDERELIIDYAYAADGAKVPRDPTLDVPFNDGFAFAHLARPGGVPSIHMPRWASRITLEITGVRVERLQSISREDSIAEGIEPIGDRWRHYFYSAEDADEAWEFPQNSFGSLWASINGTESWDANPWVWVVEFKRITQ